MKPFYKILIIIGIVAVVALGIYFAWSKIAAPAPTTPNTTETNPALPGASGSPNQTNNPTTNASSSGGRQKTTLKKISDGPVFDFWTVPDADEVYYFTPNGQVLAAKDGPDLPISSQTIGALNRVLIGPGNKKVLAAFGNPATPQWGVFDLLDKTWRPLPSNITNAAWGIIDSKLVALVSSANNINLSQVDLSKTPPAYQVSIKDFRLKNVSLTTLPNQKIIITEKPSVFYSGRVWQFDPKTSGFNLLESPANGLILRWSDDKSVAFQFSSPANLTIITGDLKNGLSSAITTLPEKCNASASTTYCFEPQNIPAAVSLPDDYFQKKFYSIDNLISLGLSTGNVTNVLRSNANNIQPLDGYHPQISNNKIYFINRYDNYLYELQLNNQ